MKNAKKLLALLLAVSLSFSHILTTYADTLEQPQDPDSPIELEMEDLDPDTLHIKKLGEIEEEPEEEEVNFEFNADDIVRVSIVLDKASTIDAGYSTEGIGTNKKAIAYREQVKQQQRQVTKAIESKLNKTLDVKWNLTLAVNIISANVRYGDINKIKMVDGVKNVFLENRYEPCEDSVSDPQTANTSSGMVGATAAWAAGYTGAGSRIAIIDTGIDKDHQSFSADGFNYAINSLSSTPSLLTQTELNNLKSQLNSKSSNYVSTKIPYGYNYVDSSTEITHLKDQEGEHGSHVAGIAAANRFIKQGNSYVEAATSVFAVGMAPDAQLLIMKVFGAGGGAYDSDYFAALEDAIVLGADSANLSLGGGSPGFTFSDEYQEFLNSLSTNKNNKMVVSISAGNTGAITDEMETELYIDDVSMHTGGSPGTFINSMGTAAAQNIGTVGAPLTFNGSQSVYYTETDSTGAKMTTITGSYSYVYIDAIGEASDYSTVNSAVSLSGKIVIVNRGENTFVEKGNNAISYSPKALIVANNQKGSISMSLDDFTGTFPMVSITLSDAETIKENSTARTTGGITYYTGTVTVTSDTQSALISDRKEAEITDFSSWGVPGSLLMKPEITAPGGDIYSVNGENYYNGTHGGGQDQYEFMSGTSMAAPHIAGLAAVVAQYVRENNLSEKNTELTDKYSTRAIVQSLLMSTATPMRNDGEYVSILQQGSGLAEVHEAVSASSIIMISDEDKTLTAATGAAADGKVKVEFGDDPARDGYYEYSFTIYNIADRDLTFDLDTHIFTQGSYDYEGETFMDRATTSLNANVNYIWAPVGDVVSNGHDVDKDGDTDQADAQALADYLSGKISGSALDLAAAEMDNDGKLTSYDIHLLLNWEPEEGTYANNVVPANSSRKVTVQITVNDPKIGDYPNGAYIEGFTYVVCTTTDGEGVNYTHSHSIPLLGFYGSWTDPSMFDNTSYVDTLYGVDRTPYTGHTDTNYVTLTYNGASTVFTGNPYMVEDKFPSDRLAVNSNSTFNRIVYNLYRSAGTTGYAVSRIDDYDGDITEVLSSTVIGNEILGIYYSQSSESWQNLTTKMYSPGKKPSDYGLKEGDMFRIGFYAIPEYNAMMISDDMTDAEAGMLSAGGFRQVLLENTLGRGAFIGYDFVVDNTDPVVTSATLSGNTLTVSASDETNLAYVAVLSLDGKTIYAEEAPGEKTFSISFNAAEAIANARGYVAVFVGDYAGNEAAVAVKVNDNAYEDKVFYVLTDTLTAGNDYVIANTRNSGTGYAIGHSNTTIAVNTVKVKSDSLFDSPYIDSADVAETSVWTAGSGYTLKNGNYYLRRNSNTGSTLQVSTTNSYNTWTWDGTNNRLSMTISSRNYYLRYYNNTFSLNTSTNSVYLYVKTIKRVEIDPYSVSDVTVTPGSLDLYKGNTADLTAKVTPLTASNRTVSWSSSNTSVATVDSSGHVTAVGAGTATITATSNADSTKSATCSVNVVSINKALNGIIWDEEGKVYFSSFNANSLPTWNKLHSDDKGKELMNAFMQTTSALYAGTLDTSSISTTIYSVNRSSYALTEYGENYVGAFGMCKGVTRYTDYYVYAFAKYIIFGNLAPEEEDGETYSGWPYGLLDISTAVGDGIYVCGICAKSVGSTSSSYYFLDELGSIWQTTASISSSISFSTPTKVMDTGIATSFLYQSIYYDGTYIYWAHQDGDSDELIIINPSSKVVYHAGDFGENVWPVGGIYVNGSVAPASATDETMDLELDLQPLATRDELVTDEFRVRLAAEVEKFNKTVTPATEEIVIVEEQVIEEILEITEEIPAVEDTEEVAVIEEPEITAEEEAEPETVNEVTGSTESIRNVTPFTRKVTGSSNTSGAEATVTLSEDTQTTNGIFTISYDKETLGTPTVTFTNAANVQSYNIDAENGVITFVYASKTPIAVNTAIATVRFTVPCADASVSITTKERNTALSLNETGSVTLAGQGHDWNDPAYVWANDNSTVTATRTCKHNSSHVETETATATSTVTKPATCTEAGERTYTASFNNSAFVQQTKTEVIAMIAHNLTHHDKVDPTCTADGMAEYWECSVCHKLFKDAAGTQETTLNELKLSRTGHNWGEWTVTTPATCTESGTETRTCQNDPSHKETREIPANGHTEGTAVIENNVEPTCTADGSYDEVVYCTVCQEELSRTHKTVEALGHNWSDWTETTHPTCTVAGEETRTCSRCGETETRSVAALGHDLTLVEGYDATCTEIGKKPYYVCDRCGSMFFDAEGSQPITDESEIVIPAKGHTAGETVIENNVDPTCTAAGSYDEVVYCTVCQEELSRNTVTVAALGHDFSEWTVTTPATCTEPGEETRKCSRCGETETRAVSALGHTPAEAVKENETAPECETDGGYDMVVYCSVCHAELSREHTVIPATGHSWNQPTWSWNDDMTQATATFICANDTSHTVNKTGSVEIDEEASFAPTHEADGLTVYVASVIGPDGETYTGRREVVIARLKYDFKFVEFSWSDDFTAAEAVYRDEESGEVRNIKATVTPVTVEPTCTQPGSITYTASVNKTESLDSQAHEESQSVTLNALGHDFGEWTLSKAPTCTEAGEETRICSRCDAKETREVAATGHDWGKITYSWSDDYSHATAVQPCNNDHSHDITETVETTSEITLKPTCTELGETTYTAAFTNKLFETQRITLKNVPATGHTESEPVIENEKPATCTADGSYDEVVYCSICHTELSRKTVKVPATGHKAGEAVRENEVAATCTEKGGYDLVVRCTVCNEILSSEHVTTDALGHDFSEWKQTKAPTCTEAGEETRTCSRCNEKETREIAALGHKPAAAVKENNVEPTCEKEGGYDMVVYCSVCGEKLSSEHTTVKAIGHSWGEWTFNGAEAKTHTRVCSNDPSHKETGSCQFDEGVTVGDTTTYTCSICHGTYTVTAETPLVDGIVRVAGENRYGTAMSVTDFFMEANGVEKLKAMVIASGANFADALAGSYLASVKDCPIMLIDDKHASEVEKYIAEVMDPAGKVYILGGEKAVSAQIEKDIKKSVADVERLAGDNRYLTNIEILKETGLDADTILVATGKDFADSLSASASGLPILLVKDALDKDQLSFLKSVKGKNIIILGGEKAVNAQIEKQLKQYGTVSRVAGANRFETSVKIAEKLFKAPKAAVLAFSNEFPDGLCGGPLGQLIEGPVILTRPDKAEIAREYLKKAGISDGVVLGGEARIDDETVRKLYGLKSSSVIELYHK